MAVVVIDPGHGGRDPGAIGPGGTQEKNIALAVALKAAAILQGAGIDVRLTRDTDKHLGPTTAADLSARAKMANDVKADCFVSIHCNAAANRTATGTETYRYQSQGDKLAIALQRHLVAELKLPDRGVKQANFAVLRETKMPAALVELGFISNPAEEKLLKDQAYQDMAARAIAKGVAECVGVKMDTDRTAVLYRSITGEDIELEGRIIDGKTYVEVRKLCEALGLKVIWDPVTKNTEVRL